MTCEILPFPTETPYILALRTYISEGSLDSSVYYSFSEISEKHLAILYYFKIFVLLMELHILKEIILFLLLLIFFSSRKYM
jgi:hypothetical protein